MKQMLSRTIQKHSFVMPILLAGVSGCTTPQPPSAPAGSMPLYLDDSRMQAEILQYVPIGMSVSAAKKVMERHGFECRIEETSLLPEIDTPTRLRCARIRPQDNPAHQGIVLDEICVYMSIEADKVKAIKVRHLRTSM